MSSSSSSSSTSAPPPLASPSTSRLQPPPAHTGGTLSAPATAGGGLSADATSAFLRRRSNQLADSPPLQPPSAPALVGSLSAGGGSSMANRRSGGVRAMNQSDFGGLAFTALSPPSTPPMPPLTRTTTPTPAASSPLTTPFSKRRAADEIQAVTDMLNTNNGAMTAGAATPGSGISADGSSGIQRPASAPPRGRRSRNASAIDLDDAGADAMEKAPSSSTLKEAPSTISEIASETIEQFAAHLSDRSLAMLFLFIVAWGAVLSLDRLTTYSYQTIATNSFSHHSSLAEVNVIRSVVAAVAAVPFATVADLGGRAQAFTAGLVLYAAGHAAMAGSTSVASYVGGVVLYELGANGLVCLQATVLADMTSSRNRLFFQIVPQMPFLVFSFISSDIYSAILPRWRWGIGLFAILGPAALLPVITILGQSQRQGAPKPAAVSSVQSMRRASLQQSTSPVSYMLLMCKHVWQSCDFVGLLLLAASLTLSLVPLTLAASAPDQWRTPKIIGMIASGISLLVLFGVWETRQCKTPVIPRIILRNRTFWGGALALTLLWTAHALMLAYFPTYLYVVHGVSNRAQQNFSVIYSFTVAAASLPIALMVRHARRFKGFTITGVVVFTAGFGLMIGYSGTIDSDFKVAASQVVIGLGGALTIALIQAAVQVAVPSMFVAQTIAALNIFPCVGNAVGAAIAGSMWTGLLPGKLARALTPTGHVNELTTVFAEPLSWIAANPLGSTTRTAVVDAYSSCWRVMMIVATLVCACSLAPLLLMNNLRLNDSLSADDVLEETARIAMAAEAAADDDSAYGDGGLIKQSKIATQSGRLFGDRLFDRMDDALGRGIVRRAPKQSVPDSPTEVKAMDDEIANASTRTHMGPTIDADTNRTLKWSAWGALRRPGRANAGARRETDGQGVQPPASPIESVGPAPILVVDEVPFAPPLTPPTPPGTRQTIRGLSPMPSGSLHK